MNNPKTAYDWQQPYTVAIWETDKPLMERRICDALWAVEDRRPSPVELGSDEDRALTEADAGIQGLITERTEKPVRSLCYPAFPAFLSNRKETLFRVSLLRPRPCFDSLYSCRTTVRRDLLILISPLYSTKPSFLNLFMNKFTRERVVPIISASVS